MLTLCFFGDFAPVRCFEPLVRSKREEVFGELTAAITNADLAFVNLEAPLCHSGNPIKKAGPNLRAHPECAVAITRAGFDVVGLANNHCMDFGGEGLLETIENCRAQELAVCGAGRNLQEAQEPLILERKGVKVAIIAVAEHEFSIAEEHSPGAAPLDPVDNLRQIQTAQKEADLVIVTIHGGNEYFALPRPGLRKLSRFYIEQGAAAVICHHAHVPGAYELHQNKPIVYSLGNFIFDFTQTFT